MKRTSSSIAVAVAAACVWQGCWPLDLADEEYRDAVPLKSDLEVRIGGGDAQTTAPAGLSSISAALDPFVDPSCAETLCQEAVDGEPTFVDGAVYELVRSAKWHVNGGLEVILGWVDAILETPYSQETATGYVWGPWSESLARIRFRFTMEKESAGHFSMALEGQNVNAAETDPWTEVVTGSLETGASPHASRGTIVLDYTAIHAIDSAYATPEAGVVTYDFDVRALPFTVTAAFDGVALGEAGSPAIDAEYDYTREDEGMAGRLSFDIDADLWPEGAPDGVYENLFVEARWTSEGQGKGGADAQGGSLESADGGVEGLSLDECWAEEACLFYQTYAVYTAHAADGASDFTYEECGADASCPAF